MRPDKNQLSNRVYSFPLKFHPNKCFQLAPKWHANGVKFSVRILKSHIHKYIATDFFKVTLSHKSLFFSLSTAIRYRCNLR